MSPKASPSGCVYVAVDANKGDRCKIGHSSRRAKLRIAEASNPDYCLFAEILTPKAKAVERVAHKVIEIAGVQRIKHKSGGISEWFELPPSSAETVVRCIAHAAEHTPLHPLVPEVCVALVAGSFDEAGFLEAHRSAITALARTVADQIDLLPNDPSPKRVPAPPDRAEVERQKKANRVGCVMTMLNELQRIVRNQELDDAISRFSLLISKHTAHACNGYESAGQIWRWCWKNFPDAIKEIEKAKPAMIAEIAQADVETLNAYLFQIDNLGGDEGRRNLRGWRNALWQMHEVDRVLVAKEKLEELLRQARESGWDVKSVKVTTSWGN